MRQTIMGYVSTRSWVGEVHTGKMCWIQTPAGRKENVLKYGYGQSGCMNSNNPCNAILYCMHAKIFVYLHQKDMRKKLSLSTQNEDGMHGTTVLTHISVDILKNVFSNLQCSKLKSGVQDWNL